MRTKSFLIESLSVFEYQNRKRQGKFVNWYRNGRKCWNGEYINGKLIAW